MKTSPHIVRATTLHTADEDRVLFCCREACGLEQRGEYEAALEALSEWCPAGSPRPRTDGLGPLAVGELLWQFGTLIGCLGSVKQTPGAQAHATELITESIPHFRKAGCGSKVGEAYAELARCSRRVGNFDNALHLLRRALKELGDDPDAYEARLVATLYQASVEHESGQLAKAHERLRVSAPLFDSCDNDVLRGKFHDNYGIVLHKLSEASDREDYREWALIEYAGASRFFHDARADRLRAMSENNCGLLSLLLGKYDESAEHIYNALKLFKALGDVGHAAEVKETLAQWHLARKRNKEAALFAGEAVKVFEKGERPASLALALTTRGVALARLGNYSEARRELSRAFGVAEKAGSREKAGLAALAAVEELPVLPFADRIKIYLHAHMRLAETQSARTRKRLDEAAREIAEAALARESADVGSTDETYAAAAGGHSPTLITGDNAEERLLWALRAHEQSGRRGPFVAFNYNTLKGGEDDEDAPYEPEDLARHVLQAAGGSILVDELQDLSCGQLEQLHLLLDEGVIEHAGAPTGRERVDVCVMVGTSADLSAEVDNGCFPVELYERLRGHAHHNDGAATPMHSTLFDERAAARRVSLEQSIEQYEVELIRRALIEAGGHPAEAARRLNTGRSTLEYKIFTKYQEELKRWLAPTVRRGRDATPASSTKRRGRRTSTRGGREGACSTTKVTKKK